MGVSIEVYRSRIGTFSSNSSAHRGSSSSSHTSSTSAPTSWTRLFFMLVCLTACLTLFTVSAYQVASLHSRANPSASTPACSSSTPCPSVKITGQFQSNLAPDIFSAANFQYFASSPMILNVNFNARYINGNRRRNGIKMAHLNLGSGYLVNNMNNIETVIGGYRPNILGISESSFKNSHDKSDVLIDDYNVFFSKTLENANLNVSRVSVFTHKDLIVKERADLMNDTFSSIWLEIGLPRHKKILVCNLYRDWQYLSQDSDSSLATSAQLERWLSFLDQWERAMQENKEIHVMGDTNLDFLKWNNPNQPGSNQRNRLHKLSHAVFDRIFPFGFVQLISVPTRFWPGQEPSGLDHWYSNKPGKLSDIQVNNHGGSDHKLLFGIRYSKAVISKPKL